MSASPINHGSDTCRHPARELLDFHVNGSLEGDDLAMVATHVEECRACAEELRALMGFASEIEDFATGAPRRWEGVRIPWIWVGAAAALLAVFFGILHYAGLGPSVVEQAADSGTGSVVRLDLGAGMMRAAGGPPLVIVTPAASTLQLTLFPPALLEAHLLIGVSGPGDVEVLPAQPLSDVDAMGRATITLPASLVRSSGTYQVVLRAAEPSGDVRTFSYPFEVRAQSHD